ncbi:MAG: sigma-70 family RNA polymerase sigma factor, partial [Nitriliruptorales bacterium]|nr:sigma-70 family RNA polymerase sigma factor [Nitriliruptorales bacterium]
MVEPRLAGGRDGLDGLDLAAIVRAHGDDLYRFALHLTRDRQQAEDLVQDGLLRAWERRGQFRGESSLRTWLHRIVHNLAIDRARRSSHEIAVEHVEERWRDDAYTVDTETVVQRAELRHELEDALIRLPHILRTPVVLHDVEGWTVPEIAELVDVSLPAAKQRLRRGRMALVSALAEGSERRAALEGVPMRCWDARRHVSDYLDGELDDQLAGEVESHLRVCPTCPPLYAALVGVHERLGRLRDPDAVIPGPLLG